MVRELLAACRCSVLPADWVAAPRHTDDCLEVSSWAEEAVEAEGRAYSNYLMLFPSLACLGTAVAEVTDLSSVACLFTFAEEVACFCEFDAPFLETSFLLLTIFVLRVFWELLAPCLEPEEAILVAWALSDWAARLEFTPVFELVLFIPLRSQVFADIYLVI